MFVGDLAQLAVSSAQRADDCIVDAVGPESFAFEELVELIAASLGVRLRLLHVSPGAALRMLRVLGPIVGDVILTREEIEGLMANLLVSNQPATGATRFTEWLASNAALLGKRYASELQRHYLNVLPVLPGAALPGVAR
jgi:NADH dehydrogenase